MLQRLLGWMGHDPEIALPHVPGHELSGAVEAARPSDVAVKVEGNDYIWPFPAIGHIRNRRSASRQ